VGVATLVRKCAKPVAVVGVTGLLSLGMVSLGSSQAQAVAGVDDLLLAPVVEGATEALLPELLTGLAAVSPVGWVVLGGLGLAAVTQDYWMPYVAGAFGYATTNKDANVPSGNPYVDPRIHLQPESLGLGANPWTVTVAGTVDTSGLASGINHGFHVAYHLHCTENKDGSGANYDKTSDGTSSYNSASGPSFSMSFACQYGYAIGATAGPFQGDPELTYLESGAGGGPGNVLHWGSTVKTNNDAFDPRSAGTKYTATVECIKDDGTRVSISADTAGDKGGIKIPSCEAAGAGHASGKVDVVGTPPGAAPGTAPTNLYSRPAPGPDPNHPLCDPTLAGPLCKLQILIDGKPCVEGQVECLRWASLAQSSPSRVQCMYGPYAVALSNCNALERAYEPGGAPATIPNTDGDPSTRSNNDPNGQPQPVPQPGADPGTAPRAGPGTVAPPAPGGAGAPAPGAPPTSDSGRCFPNGWGVFNPVEWVVGSLRCVFEPSQSSQDSVNQIPNKFSGKAPFVWFAGAGTLVAGSAAIGSAGCPNWVVHVGGWSQNVVCGSTFTAALVATRTSIFGLLVIAMFWPLIRSLWYAVIPIIRPTPMA
jgi:hypothetical protein